MSEFNGNDCNPENPTDYKPGDPCWIIVCEGYYPAGRWKGEIRQYVPDRKYNNIEAVITDPRVESAHKPDWVNPYLGRSPSSYRVMPRNKYTDELMLKIDKLENALEQVRNHYRAREGAFKDALAVFKK